MAESAKPSKHTIYVDVDDDITAIIGKVESAPHKIVALVLPKRSATLQSIVNMRLLKRSADKAGKAVALVTSEAALLPLAGAARLPVAKNLHTKPAIPASPLSELPRPGGDPDAEIDEKDAKLDYHRSIGELAATQSVEEPDTIALEDADQTEETAAARPKTPKNKKLKVPNFEKFRLLLGLGILAFVGLVVFLILALFVLPKATITIQTESFPLAANFNLKATDQAKTLDEANKIIPAALKSQDQTATQQVPATGQQNLGNKATGTVTVSNCSDSAITVPAGSGVSSGGLTFITQKTISLDSGNFDSHNNCKSSGGHIGNVDVTAQSAGSKYNIGPSNFTLSCSQCSSNVTGKSSQAMSGGTDNNVTIVSQSDVDNAKKKISSSDSDSFAKNFEKQLSDSGAYVLVSTLKISEPTTTASPDVGQQASSTTVNIKINYSVMVVQKNDLQKAISDQLNKQIDQHRQKISSTDVLNDATVSVQDQSAPATATLAISENTSAVPIIDTASVKKQALGQKTGDIKASLSGVQGIKQVDVKLSPFWVSKAPKKLSKINVVLQQSQTKP